MERPILSRQLDSKTFRSFYYLKEELVSFCRENKLPATGGKIAITNRIAHYLDTGEIMAAPPMKAKNTKRRGIISEDDFIEPNFVCSELHRAFFKEKIGPQFTFNVAFQKWLKSNTGKTYADAILAYYQIMTEKKHGKTKIDKQFEYNTYIRDFFADNRGKTLEDAIKCWKYKKSLQGHNRYEASDLNILSKHNMKTIILVRHSEPQRTVGIPNEKIPLSETGRIMAKTFFARKIFQDHKCVYSSPYLRAVETAGYLSKEIVVDERLKERALGDLESLDEAFWAKQYENLDFKNRNGESMNETSCRMDSCIGEILNLLRDGEMAVAVTHAAAICAYLTKYCTISVVNASEKTRCIQFRNETILHGQINTPCAFVLKFEQDCLVELTYIDP